MNAGKSFGRQLGLALLFVCLTISSGNSPSSLAQAPAPSAALSEFLPGEILVRVRADRVDAAGLMAAADATAVDALAACGPTSAASYRLQVPVGQELASIAALGQDPAVLVAEPNYLVYAAGALQGAIAAQPETPFVVNDPNYLERQWYLQRINASRAWRLSYDAAGFGGNLAPIQVAIVDSGIDLNHPELAENLLPGKTYVNGTTTPQDDYGHGTHVAGLVGAITNNGIGIAGVAPAVRLDPRKVLNRFGSGYVDGVVQGICDAVDEGAHIVNLSLQATFHSQLLEDAVKYAAARGVLLIGASGNSRSQPVQPVAYPARYKEVIAVAATDYNDQRASYSNYDPGEALIDLAAPGGTEQLPIHSTWARGAWCESERTTLSASGYCDANGTSMAAAVVTGAAALLWSLDRDLTAEEVRTLLTSTANPATDGSGYQLGAGRLDLQAAVHRLLPSELQLSQNSLRIQYSAGNALPTQQQTIRIENPSGEPLAWEAGLLNPPTWVKLVGANDSGVVQGEARYGQPGHITFAFSPQEVSPGIYETTAQIVGTRSDTSQVIRQVRLELSILNTQNYLNLVMLPGSGTIPPPPQSSWEKPTNADDRTLIPSTDESRVAITLPFAVELQRQTYEDAVVHSNGFLSFGEAPDVVDSTNHCLPNRDAYGAAIYGWWADLDPSASGAQISTFQSGNDRFVIEFHHVPTAAKSGETYTVNFQIVLYRNGDIGLNYGQIPNVQANPPAVTVGVETRDGLLYNQIACRDPQTELGFLPIANESLLLKANGGTY